MKSIILILTLLSSLNLYASGSQHDDHHDHDGHDHKHNLEKHVHGEVQLLISVEKNVVDILIEGPTESFIGFEHKPKSKKEKEIYKSFYDIWMKETGNIFSFPKQAKCSSRGSDISWKGQKGAKHTELSLVVKFFCSPPVENEKLSIDFKRHFKNMNVLKVDVLPLKKMPYSKEFKKQSKVTLEL